MKNLLTFTLAMMLGCQFVSAEDNSDNGGYERMFKDGRQWIAVNWGDMLPFREVEMAKMTVVG